MSIIEEIEALNLVLNDAEARFVGSRVGVNAEILLKEDTKLIYGKAGGKWGLWIKHKEDPPVPVNNGSIEQRVIAAHALPKMEEAVIAAKDERVRVIRAAVAAAEDWMRTTRMTEVLEAEEP